MTDSPLISPAQLGSTDPNHDIRVQRAHDYPQQLWYLLASFVGLLTLFRLGTLFIFWRRKKRSYLLTKSSEKKVMHWEGPVESTPCKKNIMRRIPLAIVNTFRIVTCRITLPIGGTNVLNGSELAVISGYIIAIFTWEFINCMNVTTGIKLDVNYWSDRAANIVATQLPLIVALSTKNNLISFLTGISYEKLNVLHRAAARTCLVLIWVHFWGRVKIGIPQTTLSLPWVRTGISVASAYTTLVLISLRPIRMRFYEFFFFSHFLLVLMILIGAYFHIHKGVGFGPYLVPSFLFWALDRAIRLFRVIRNNQSPFFASRQSSALYATAELLSPDMVRLTLRRDMTWKPGQSAFIVMPTVSRIPFEAHPFTIANISRTKSVMVDEYSSLEKAAETAAVRASNELVFLIRPRKGFTRRLRNAVQSHTAQDDKVLLPVYVDGPYGCPPDLNAFQSLVLIAGGSGISYTLPQFQDIVNNACAGTTACRTVLFLWVVPNRENLSWISRSLRETLETAPSMLRVRLLIHVTQSSLDIKSSGESSTSSKEHVDVSVEWLQQSGMLRIKPARPNMQTVLEEELTDAQGQVSVDVAGPAGLAADVRKALRSEIAGSKGVLQNRPDVTLHVETYGIA